MLSVQILYQCPNFTRFFKFDHDILHTCSMLPYQTVNKPGGVFQQTDIA